MTYLESNIYNFDKTANDITTGLLILAMTNQHGEMKEFLNMESPVNVGLTSPKGNIFTRRYFISELFDFMSTVVLRLSLNWNCFPY